MKDIKLGEKVKDKVTGLVGTTVSRIEYLNGCIQFGVQGKSKDGCLPKVAYIDEGQLIKMSSSKTEEKKKRDAPGGIMPSAPEKGNGQLV